MALEPLLTQGATLARWEPSIQMAVFHQPSQYASAARASNPKKRPPKVITPHRMRLQRRTDPDSEVAGAAFFCAASRCDAPHTSINSGLPTANANGPHSFNCGAIGPS